MRLAIAVSVGVLAAVVAGFVWVAIQSFELIHNEPSSVSKLKPVKITGPQQIVFRWSDDACEPEDIPDSPARAFRDAGGEVHLIASHYVTREATGPDLDHVEHRCAVTMRSAYDRSPSRFQFREWVFATYTVDGARVFALIHDEYQGNEIPGRCPSGIYERCWYNAITLARSDDGGRTFRRAEAPPHQLVAAVPYRYSPDAGRVGLFQPSNIVRKDGYYFTLVSANRYRAQEYGTCVLRTRRLDDPGSWRAWDGDGFHVSFVDPYGPRVSAGEHVCQPVSQDAIADMTFSLTYNTYLRKFLLVSASFLYSPAKRRTVWGFYYSVSDDLIHWEMRKLIREVELPQSYRCGDSDPVTYPSVLDPRSDSRNFETTGRRAYIYFTRFHYRACRQTLDRDLVRVPVEFSK